MPLSTTATMMSLVSGSTYEAKLAPRPAGTLVQYMIVARDVDGNVTLSPPGAPADQYSYTVGGSALTISLNEILADPPTVTDDPLQGDVNGDGEGDSFEDEFVELVNYGTQPVDISGWTLSDDDAPGAEFAFPAGTILPAMSFVTLFGGGSPQGFTGLVFVDDGRIGNGFGMLAFASLVGESLQAAGGLIAPDGSLPQRALDHPARAQRVIFLFMNGGLSQVDSVDPKPKLDKYHGQRLPGGSVATERKTGTLLRSPFTFKKYGQSGMEVSELFPHVGECADDICFVRSVYTDIPNHEPSMLMMNTGHTQAGRPSLGLYSEKPVRIGALRHAASSSDPSIRTSRSTARSVAAGIRTRVPPFRPWNTGTLSASAAAVDSVVSET